VLPDNATAAPRRLAVISLPNHAAVYSLPPDLEIHGVTDSTVTIVASDDELAQLRTLGYSPRITVSDYQTWIDSLLAGYRTYAQVCSAMVALAGDYPLICRLETLGFSVQNRAILMMRVTDNPQIEEAEPEFRIVGPHHGDEKIGSEVALSFLQYVLASYDTSTAIRDLVDSTELWVIPVFNVDGHVANNRTNANGIDLNRDYGYRWSGMGNSPSPFSQPETRLMRQHDLDNNISMEFAYHSAAAYVNYLWDNHPADPPDSGLVASLARQYADSTYGSSTTELEPINGYAWYEVDGSCQDANFGLFGNLALIRLRRTSPASRRKSTPFAWPTATPCLA
jgi:murein tripeptide amidase MpaA